VGRKAVFLIGFASLLTNLCVFQLAGLAVIAFGLWLRFGGAMAEFASDKRSPEYFFIGLYVLVGAGALMTTVGFFGCCGAARESQFLLGAFFACLLVIFAAEITAGVFAFIGKKVAIQEAQKIYEDIYEEYMKNPGKVNRTIYHYHLAVSSHPELKYLNCLVEIHNVIDASLHLVGIVGIAIAGTTIFGMIFSMVLCCAIRNTRDMI
uniref:Tetraspanin 2 n=1 Tax=Phasianus colchicus TaxID=9054 RepID=A0A669QFT1_PHACC